MLYLKTQHVVVPIECLATVQTKPHILNLEYESGMLLYQVAIFHLTLFTVSEKQCCYVLWPTESDYID